MARIAEHDDDTSSGDSPLPTANRFIRFSTSNDSSPIRLKSPWKKREPPYSASPAGHRGGRICEDSVPVHISRPPPHHRPRNHHHTVPPHRHFPHPPEYAQQPGYMQTPDHTHTPQYPMYPIQQTFYRPHPFAPAQALHDLGHGPTPLFGWDSVMPLPHGYGQPKYVRHVKPDYRRFCFSVGKADVPFAALPGGPLYGFPTTMSPQLLNRF